MQEEVQKKPSCEEVYPDCSKYKDPIEKCPCCGGEINQWGVFDKHSDEGFTGLQCKVCEWSCSD